MGTRHRRAQAPHTRIRSFDHRRRTVVVLRVPRIDPAEYRDRITHELSPDPGDRVHVAACLDGRADLLLTRNTKDFPVNKLAAAGVSVMTADDFLVALLGRRPAAVREAFEATAAA